LRIHLYNKKDLLKYAFFCITICISTFCFAQRPTATSKSISALQKTFNASNSFIENIGQYGKTMKGYEQMGELKFGYEGLGMPILFTAKGLIHLHRKVEKISKEEEEKLEKAGVKEEEIERKKNITDRTITMEWIGANDNVQIITEEKTYDYHTYGMLTEKAYGYKKIIYKNIYDGIDVVYSFTENPQDAVHKKLGFEYSLIVQPGANLSKVKMKFGGDVKSITTNSKGSLIIKSDIDGIEETIPVSYYGNNILQKNIGEVKTEYRIANNEISFSFPANYDKTKALVIDPFVSGTTNLTGIQAGKAIDVDYDYAGNVYVAGGGRFVSTFAAGATHQHAKYNSAGVLQWTFNGVLTIPTWQADFYYGGWVVDKATGNLFIGQGFAIQGFRVIRLSTTGLYDNYISTGVPAFQEAWKMYWLCNNGTPQIICAGGGTTGPTNFAVCSPPSPTLVSPTNLTGSSVAGQDMTDLVIDPVTNSLYTIYASPLDANTANKIFKNNPPYSAASIAWSTFTGYPSVINELRNRPYLAVGYNDNGSNILAQNSTYIFYWDGLNLKAFNKTTGAVAGAPLLLGGNTVLMQGGIAADACDNVFIGNTNGTIKVYKFNGATFDDAAAADITISGFSTKSVFDLALDESKKILYASGDGFVASLDVAAYCPTFTYTLNIVPNCATASATASISPLPPSGSTVTYVLYNGTTQLATNTTGIFTNLLPNINYTIVATINIACSGTQTTANFTLPGPTIVVTPTNTTCGNSTGQISIVASTGTAPYSYSLDGILYSTLNPITGLAAGIYTVFVKDNSGCISKATVTILNSDGPTFTFTQTNATCGSNVGTVTVTAVGGTAPYQYSINNGVTYQSNNFFTGLNAGTYVIKVKDAAGCINASNVTILSGPAPLLNAIPASATCGLNNGTITAFGSGGTAPLLYSINGNIFQAANIFSGLTPGAYTVTVKDAIGCIFSVNVTVANNPPPTLTATTTSAVCNNANGSITATGLNGVAPLQFSIDGITFQASNLFSGLVPGTYTVTVKDFSGCTATVNVTVGSSSAPLAAATVSPANCGANDGVITVTGFGTPPFTYSINGFTYQASNVFTNVAAGNYIATVKDAAGCIGATIVLVSSTAPPNLTVNATPASCLINDGTITASATGGTAPLQYSINGTNFFLSGTFTGLAANTYTVTVKDALGCINTKTIVVANASGLTLAVSAVFSSCGSNGIITAIATGGALPLQFNINGGAYQGSNIFSGLAPGNYIVNVKDANGCIITKQASILATSLLSLSINNPIQASCSGNNAVIIATGSGGALPYTYSINGTVYQTSGAFLNVPAGPVTVYVKDASGCIATQTLTIINLGGSGGITTFTARAKFFPCDGDVSGKIDQFRINGATCNTCTFSLDFGPFVNANDPIFNTVTPAPGTHYVTVRDVNGCTKTIAVIFAQSTLATVTAVITPAACNTSNGSITLTGAGINQPYHISYTGIGGPWITFDPSTTIPNLSAGIYTILLADDASFTTPPDNPGGCINAFTFIVPSLSTLAIATTQTPVGCYSNNGTITATGSLGTGPYTYNINGGAYQPSGAFTSLAAGDYIVTVKDALGCIKTVVVTLIAPSLPTVTAIVLPAACASSSGTITANAGLGGTAPYEYSLNGTVFQSSNIFTGLAPGGYTLYIRDVNGCTSSIPILITTVTPPKITAYSAPASCNNNDGAIVGVGSLGTAPYQFSIDGIVYQSNNLFNGLAAGFYTVYIKDDRGCITTTGIAVGNIGAPTFTNTVVAARCGNQNGSITVTATGGTAPYQYSSDGGLTYQSISNILTPLFPGTYTVIVKDANGCKTTKAILVPNTFGPQTLTAVILHAACGLSNGTVTLTATGGTPAYSYSKDGVTYQASNVLTGFGAGTFTVYVRDINLCIKTLSVTIIDLPAPTLTATSSPATCGVSDGTITAIATGGTQPLSYSKNNVVFQTSNIFTGLAAGTYTITVADARNCRTNVVITVGTVGATLSPTITCGTTTSSSIIFNWLTVAGATGYTISYTINGGAANNIGAIGNLLTYQVTGLNANDNVVITVTPTGVGCFTGVTKTCTTLACPVVTATISYAGPFCTTITAAQNVTLTGTGVFTGGTYSSTAGLTINATTGAITPSTSTASATPYVVTYTIAASGGCLAVITTTNVTINPKPAPIIISHN
jgi:large repetitive protein